MPRIAFLSWMFQGQNDDKRKRNVSYLFLQFYFLGDLNYHTPSSERDPPQLLANVWKVKRQQVIFLKKCFSH